MIVKDILKSDNNLFTVLQNSHSTLYTTLFGTENPASLQNLLLIKCGNKYASNALTDHNIYDLCNILVMMFSDKWSKIKSALNINYNVNNQFSNTTTENIQETYIADNNDSSTNTIGIYGFDSNEAVDSQKENNSTDYDRNETRTKTRSVTNSGSKSDIQTSIEKEIELRKIKFLDIIIKDISNEISLSIY